ncbi:hypothetical protein BC940DRAFT_150801 [Gongronella butleri]|nr:hypothetical protein BC940DRAFT_150801 [Gongronella butleri]
MAKSDTRADRAPPPFFVSPALVSPSAVLFRFDEKIPFGRGFAFCAPPSCLFFFFCAVELGASMWGLSVPPCFFFLLPLISSFHPIVASHLGFGSPFFFILFIIIKVRGRTRGEAWNRPTSNVDVWRHPPPPHARPCFFHPLDFTCPFALSLSPVSPEHQKCFIDHVRKYPMNLIAQRLLAAFGQTRPK